jgi:hypothetical protein
MAIRISILTPICNRVDAGFGARLRSAEARVNPAFRSAHAGASACAPGADNGRLFIR